MAGWIDMFNFVQITPKIVKIYSLLIGILMAFILSSCGDDSQFRVAGEIKNMGTQNIRVIYVSNGAVKSLTSTVIDGKFSFVGYSPELTIVRLFSNNKTPLGTLVVKNGETIDCTIHNGDRYNAKMEGSDLMAQWSDFIAQNAQILSSDDIESRNQEIAKYVAKNPSKLLSTVLMITEFYTPGYEQLADSLMAMITPEAQPRHLIEDYASTLAHITSENALGKVLPMNLYEKGDSLFNFNASKASYSVLCFTMPDDECRDSIVPLLKQWNKTHKDSQLKIVDISLANDTFQWKKSITTDSAKWAQCWALGSVQAKGIDRLGISRMPFFIVTDSTGAQLYRGNSISHAQEIINQKLQ